MLLTLTLYFSKYACQFLPKPTSPTCFPMAQSHHAHTYTHGRIFIVSDNEAIEVVLCCEGATFKAAAALVRRNRVLSVEKQRPKVGERLHDNRQLPIVAACVCLFASGGAGSAFLSVCESLNVCICLYYYYFDILDSGSQKNRFTRTLFKR